MEAKAFLLEVVVGTDQEINKIFNYALAQVFTPSYVSKIESILKKDIKIKEVSKNQDFAAYVKDKDIVINKPIFYSLPREKQVVTLLHEFVHILQKYKFLFFSKFKEVNKLTNQLNDIVKNNLVKPLSIFLTGKNKKMHSDDKEEILAYLISGTIDWSALKPQGKKLFIQALQNSGIINLGSKFFQKRF